MMPMTIARENVNCDVIDTSCADHLYKLYPFMNKILSRYFADREIIPLLFILYILLSTPADSPILCGLEYTSNCNKEIQYHSLSVYQEECVHDVLVYQFSYSRGQFPY
jgi:hypothetical protein